MHTRLERYPKTELHGREAWIINNKKVYIEKSLTCGNVYDVVEVFENNYMVKSGIKAKDMLDAWKKYFKILDDSFIDEC